MSTARGRDKDDDYAAVRLLAMLPAWLLSVAAHLLFAVVGSLIVRGTSSVALDEPARAAEIVLARRETDHTEYFTDEFAGERYQALKPVGMDGASALPGGTGSTSEQPPLILGISLPALPGNLPVGDALLPAPDLGGRRGAPRLPSNAVDEAAILAEDALIPREKLPTGPTAQLSLFGSQEAVGRSFAFVIDHSNSMGGDGLGATQAAAKELAAQIDRLTDRQTFQVVAYNQAVTYFTERELIPATADNKRKLVRFIADIAAYGQTEHSRGLLAALRLKPEVIFLLTDGGDPALDAGQMRLIREQAAGRTCIHCIHFGRGPKGEGATFLAKLAAQNRGSYVYIDMNAR